MALAPDELGISVVGLAVGYWVVSYLYEKYGSARTKPEATETPQAATESWWDVLGVPPNASRDDIARAYKKKISEYHPDKVAHMGEEIRALAASRAQAINAAYDQALRNR